MHGVVLVQHDIELELVIVHTVYVHCRGLVLARPLGSRLFLGLLPTRCTVFTRTDILIVLHEGGYIADASSSVRMTHTATDELGLVRGATPLSIMGVEYCARSRGCRRGLDLVLKGFCR